METYREFWHNTLDAFESNPELATPMAINLAVLRDLIRSKRGVKEATELLEQGIAEIYPNTDFNLACVKLFRRYISKRSLLPKDDPIMILQNLEETDRERRLRRKKTVKATKKKSTLKLVKKNAA